jgi:hypothetical protein
MDSICGFTKTDSRAVGNMDSKFPVTVEEVDDESPSSDAVYELLDSNSEHIGQGSYLKPYCQQVIKDLLESEPCNDFRSEEEDDELEESDWLDNGFSSDSKTSEPVYCYPYQYTIPHRHNRSIELEFTMPPEIKNFKNLVDVMSGKALNRLVLSISKNHIDQKFGRFLHFAQQANHFTPEMVHVTRVNTKGCDMRLDARLFATDANGSPVHLTSNNRVSNLENDDLSSGFIVPPGIHDDMKDGNKLIWANNEAKIGDRDYHRWKGIFIRGIKEYLNSVQSKDNLWYNVPMGPSNNCHEMKSALQWLIATKLGSWLRKAKTDDSYNGKYRNEFQTQEQLFTSSSKGGDIRIPCKYLDEELDNISQKIRNVKAICFDKGFQLELSPHVPGGLTAVQQEIDERLEAQESASIVTPSLRNFVISITISGEFHIVVPQGRRHHAITQVGHNPFQHHDYVSNHMKLNEKQKSNNNSSSYKHVVSTFI